MFVKKITQFPTHLMVKWKEEMNNDSIADAILENAFQKIYAATISTKLRSFQFRLFHTILTGTVLAHLFTVKHSGHKL